MINTVPVSQLGVTSYLGESCIVRHHVEHVDWVVLRQEAHDFQMVVVEGNQVSTPLGFLWLHKAITLDSELIIDYDVVGVS